MIWASIFIMIAIAVVAMFAGIYRQKNKIDVDREQQNIDILRQQLADLKQQHAAGELSDDDFQRAHDELAVTLQNDIAQTDVTVAGSKYQQLHSQRVTGIIILLCVGIITPVLYYKLGNPAAIDAKNSMPADAAHQSAGHDAPGSIEVMVQRLEQKMQANPDNAEGWFMLGRSYMVMRKYDKAVPAFEHAFRLNASDPDVLVSYADALAMQSGGGISGKSFELVKQALELDPANKVALWLTAMGYEAQNDYKSATGYWQRLLPLMQAEPQQYTEVEARLQNAANRAGIKLAKQPVAKIPVSSKQLKVTVSLADKFKQSLKGSETVFVFARAAKGPPQPLAAKRLTVGDLPATIVLDDSMAMIPSNKLSDHKEVYVGARVSRNGNPIAASGDIQGRSKVLDMRKSHGTVTIVMDQEVL